MNNSYINSLSANSQFNSIGQVTAKLLDLVQTLFHLHPAIISKRITISYDEQMENRILIQGQTFSETMNEVRRTSAGKDAVTKWYLFIKKHSHISNGDISLSRMENNGHFTDGHACSNITSNTTTFLLSLGGCVLTESETLTISNPSNSLRVANAHSIISLMPLVPCYEPSDKHKAKPYKSAKGELVAAMPLNMQEAQYLLLQSIKYGKDYWGFHRSRNEYYRFKPTYPDKLVFHGFKIEEHEVPGPCQELFR